MPPTAVRNCNHLNADIIFTSTMNIEQVRAFALSLPAVTEDMPYGDDMIVFRIEGKIFLHLPLEYAEPHMSVKLDPDIARELREIHDGITPAWHLNKTHWSDIRIEGHFDESKLKGWITDSYRLVVSKLPKRLKEQYQI
jgi:predicted DNA-binding protein (MmcQ/YjbR family)